MKFWYFIKWCYNKIKKDVAGWQSWHWMWFVTMCLMWGYVFAPKDSKIENVWLTMLTATVAIYWIGYVCIFNSIKSAWNNFNKEQQDLVESLKVDHDPSR